MTRTRKKPREATRDDALILLTGFPSYVARRLCRELLERRPAARILLLHSENGAVLDAFLKSLPEAQRRRVESLAGNVSHMDLGLSSDEYGRLTREVTEIQHAAWAYLARGHGATLRRVNVRGTREVVELAGQCQALVRLVHWSTVHVSGCRQGVVMEEDLECGQRFHSAFEQTRYEAERLVRRASRTLPVTVLRPGVIVGDSETGELERYEGPWRLMERFLMASPTQPALLPGTGNAPVHAVPIDFVVRAGVYLSTLPEAEGRTYHLVDPAPLPAKRTYALVARKAHRKPPQQVVPKVVSRLLRLHPKVERFSPFAVAPVEVFDLMVLYNCQNTLSALEDTDIRCPPFNGYVERLIAHVRDQHTPGGGEEDLPVDPLD